jgi:hypothetical protein
MDRPESQGIQDISNRPQNGFLMTVPEHDSKAVPIFPEG